MRDPEDDFIRWEEEWADDEEWMEENHPYCDLCGHPIEAEYALHLDGIWICEDCVSDRTESWIDEADERRRGA